MNQKQAEYFLEIINSGSITIAAKNLYISQPALSQVIKNLENELQFPLFIRNTSPIRLTRTGERMVDIARTIIAFNQSVQDQITALRNIPIYSLRFSVLPGQAQELIPHILEHSGQALPEAEVSITEAGSRTIEQRLLDNHLDLGIIDGLPTNLALEYLPLKENRMVLVVKKTSDFAMTHPNGSAINFGELHSQKFVTKPVGCYSRLLLDTLSQAYGISLQIMYEFDNLAHIVELFSKLDCVSLMPFSFYNSTPQLMENANQYHIDYTGMRYCEYLCHRKDLFMSDYLLKFIADIQMFFA